MLTNSNPLIAAMTGGATPSLAPQVPPNMTVSPQLAATLTGGGDQPGKSKPSASRMNFDQIKEWNSFMDKNNEDGDLINLYSKYKKMNPKTSISFDALRNELDLLAQKSRNMAKTRNELTADSAHTANRFPEMKVMGGAGDYGPVNGDLKAANGPAAGKGVPAWRIKNSVPDDIPDNGLLWDHTYNQPYYKDGDEIVYVDRKFYNNGRFYKKPAL